MVLNSCFLCGRGTGPGSALPTSLRCSCSRLLRGLQMDELVSPEPNPLLFCLSLLTPSAQQRPWAAFASQESKRIPEVILKRLKPGEWGSAQRFLPCSGKQRHTPCIRDAVPATLSKSQPLLCQWKGRERRKKAGRGEMMMEKGGDKQICFIRHCIS